MKRIKEAGAIVLAKSNMAEWAFTPYETLSSILPGYTKNPVRARSRDRGIERRNRGGGRRELRRRRPRIRHRQLDPRALLASGAGRHPIDDGADEPGRRDAAEPAGGHRRPDGAHASTDAVAVFQVIVGEDPDDPATAAVARPAARELRARRSCATGCGRAHRRAAAGLRARHDRSRDRAGVHERASRICAAPARPSSIRRASKASSQIRRAAGRRAVHGLQVRHQSLSRLARRSHPGEEPRRDREVAAASIRRCSAGSSRRSKAPRTARTRRRARRRRSIASRCAPPS